MVETGKICPRIREAENQYTRAGRDRLFKDRESIYWPSLSRRGVRSLGGALDWARCTAVFEDFTRADCPIPRQIPVPEIIRVRDLYLRARRHAGGEKMTLQKRGGESEETEDLTVPLRVEAPESSTPRTSGRKRQGKAITSIPKKSKVTTSAPLVARVAEVETY